MNFLLLISKGIEPNYFPFSSENTNESPLIVLKKKESKEKKKKVQISDERVTEQDDEEFYKFQI